MTRRLPVEVRSALHEGRQAYVAVDASSGPHVTPELYAYSGDRIWFASAVSTVKAKVLTRTGTCALAVAVPGRTVVLRGIVESFDPRRPLAIASKVRSGPAAGRALVAYAARNASDLLAFGTDLGRGRLGFRPPPLRALFALDPTDGAVVERGAVTQGWGVWGSDAAAAAGEARPGGTTVIAAVPGPVALPASWHPADSLLRFEAGLTARLPAASPFPIAFVSDEYSAPGPDAKQGLLLRGIAHATCDPAEVMVELDRAVEWDGVETTATALDSAAPT